MFLAPDDAVSDPIKKPLSLAKYLLKKNRGKLPLIQNEYPKAIRQHS